MSLKALKSIPKVNMDGSGIFKYILIKVHEKHDESNHVLILRGYKRCMYHSDILDEVEGTLTSFRCDCIGGGRICHDPETKTIKIYGYSQGFGKADHEESAKLIKEVYPDYKISVSDDGY